MPDSSEALIDDEKHSESDDSEEEDESLADGDLSVIQAGFMEPCKMVNACYYTNRDRPIIDVVVGSCRASGPEHDARQSSSSVSYTSPV